MTNTQQTPWGASETRDVIVDGITFHSTVNHGGIELSDSRVAQMPLAFRDTYVGKHTDFPEAQHWYEEDCDYARVVVVFPEHFPSGIYYQACACLDSCAERGEFPADWKDLLAAHKREMAA